MADENDSVTSDSKKQTDLEAVKALEQYETNDDILNHPYKLLSSKPQAPRACMIGKPRDVHKGIAPGPGSYDLGMKWTKKGSPRMMPPLNVSLKQPDVDTLTEIDPKPPKSKAFSLSFRTHIPDQKLTMPGPQEYQIPSQFKGPKKEDALLMKCNFGEKHMKPKYSNQVTPGPGQYEHVPTKVSPRSFRKAPSMKNIPRPPIERKAPGPGAYDLPSTFKPHHGATPVSIKGRLAHPFDDKNAVHEGAKTSSPRNFTKKMKASPRLR